MKKLTLIAFITFSLTQAQSSLAQLKVTTAGDVGIGTSTPSEKLHVVGDGLFTSTPTSFASAALIRGNNNYSTKDNPDYTWTANN